MTIGVRRASGRGVAEKWRKQRAGTDWGPRLTPQFDRIYKQLCDLGDNPSVDDVVSIVGNKSYTHIECDGCYNDVEVAIQFGVEYEADSEYEGKSYCFTCIKEAAQLIDVPQTTQAGYYGLPICSLHYTSWGSCQCGDTVVTRDLAGRPGWFRYSP